MGDQLAYDRLVPPGGFVLKRHPTITAPRSRSSLTSTALSVRPVRRLPMVQVLMTTCGPQVLSGAPRQLSAGWIDRRVDRPQTGLDLAEECARLRRDNQRLLDEVARLRAEVNRLTDGPSVHPQREALELDDSARRFSLIELDL